MPCLKLQSQTQAIHKAIDPNYTAEYDGGYGAVGPEILETYVINDSTVIRKMQFMSGSIYYDTLHSDYYNLAINKAKSCEDMSKYFVNMTYCFLDSNAVLPVIEKKTDKAGKMRKNKSLIFFFVLGAFALYPLCRKMGQ